MFDEKQIDVFEQILGDSAHTGHVLYLARNLMATTSPRRASRRRKAI